MFWNKEKDVRERLEKSNEKREELQRDVHKYLRLSFDKHVEILNNQAIIKEKDQCINELKAILEVYKDMVDSRSNSLVECARESRKLKEQLKDLEPTYKALCDSISDQNSVLTAYMAENANLKDQLAKYQAKEAEKAAQGCCSQSTSQISRVQN